MDGRRSYTLAFQVAHGATAQSLLALNDEEAKTIAIGRLVDAGVTTGILRYSQLGEIPHDVGVVHVPAK